LARIALDQAPPIALPRRFLLTAPLWGVVAGALLLAHGDDVLASRWEPATLAVVHALALGLLGNVMCGSLLQFLPAALGARVRGGERAGVALHALLNAGTLLLVSGLGAMRSILLIPGACLLALAFALLAAQVLPALAHASGPRLVRIGIAQALLSALVAVTLGVAMAHGLHGRGLPPVPWANVHAAFGLVGWVLVLVASVGRIVMPMFQGTRAPAARPQAAWMLFVALLLLAALGSGAMRGRVLGEGVALAAGTFALAGLWLQARRMHARNPWLLRFWHAGLVLLVCAALALVLEAPALLVGLLALAIALPLLVIGMQLEIVAFIGWIELQRRTPRGTRLPPVQELLPDRDKRRVLLAQGMAAAGLLLAWAWPDDLHVRLAGVLFGLAHAWLWWTLGGVGRRSLAFLREIGG
jgi:hypothetical protein